MSRSYKYPVRRCPRKKPSPPPHKKEKKGRKNSVIESFPVFLHAIILCLVKDDVVEYAYADYLPGLS